MKNTPEGQQHKLRKALGRLEAIQPSDVPELAHGWLERLNDDGLPHATSGSVDAAGRLIIKLTKDEGPVHTPPYYGPSAGKLSGPGPNFALTAF
jgi:hypothetical protein